MNNLKSNHLVYKKLTGAFNKWEKGDATEIAKTLVASKILARLGLMKSLILLELGNIYEINIDH